MSDYLKPSVLSEEHYENVLAPRGISREVAEERGYASVEAQHSRWLKERGFPKDGVRNAIARGAILIPTPGAAGIDTYQLRPDRPRKMSKGERKYESQHGVPNTLDVHPRSREHLDNREVPLVIAESPLKADALLSTGVQCAVSIRGSFGWRTKGYDDATVALPEFELISWKDRDVSLVFDSDVTENANVGVGAIRLASLLQRRGANVTILYPPALPGSKYGVDDFLASGGSPANLVVLDLDGMDGNEGPEKELSPEMLREIAGDPLRMMDKLVAFYSEHLFAPSWVHDLMAVWAAHTHAIEAFTTTAYLSFTSEEPDSGKSRALELLQMTCRDALTTMNVSDAALFRAIEAFRPTLLLDEMDGMLGDKQDKKMFVSMLNAGYRVGGGACVLRIGGPNRDELERFSPFCPKAMGGIGDDLLPPALHSRCLHIPMKPRLGTEPGGGFVYEDELKCAETLHDRLAAWAKLNLDELRALRPELPDGFRNRRGEVSRPLLAVASVLGGEWQERIARALSEVASDKKTSWGVKLLEDCRTIFLAHAELTGETEIAKVQMVQELKKLPDAPWDGWDYDSNKLSRKLRHYGVPSDTKVGPADKRVRGWKLADFEDAWARHLPPVGRAAEESAPSVLNEISDHPSTQDEPKAEEWTDGRKDGAGQNEIASGRPGTDERPSPFLRLTPLSLDEART